MPTGDVSHLRKCRIQKTKKQHRTKELIWCKAFKLYQQTWFVLGLNNECPSILFCDHFSSLSKAETEKEKTSSSLSELGQSNGCAWLRSQMMVFAIHVFFSSDFFADQFFKFFGLFQMSCSVAMFQLCLHFLHSHLILWILFVVLKCNVNMEKKLLRNLSGPHYPVSAPCVTEPDGI